MITYLTEPQLNDHCAKRSSAWIKIGPLSTTKKITKNKYYLPNLFIDFKKDDYYCNINVTLFIYLLFISSRKTCYYENYFGLALKNCQMTEFCLYQLQNIINLNGGYLN